MSTDLETTIDSDTEAILKRVLQRKPLDPDLYRRIREDGKKVTEEIRRTRGVLDIAVDLIRETRSE